MHHGEPRRSATRDWSPIDWPLPPRRLQLGIKLVQGRRAIDVKRERLRETELADGRAIYCVFWILCEIIMNAEVKCLN